MSAHSVAQLQSLFYCFFPSSPLSSLPSPNWLQVSSAGSAAMGVSVGYNEKSLFSFYSHILWCHFPSFAQSIHVFPLSFLCSPPPPPFLFPFLCFSFFLYALSRTGRKWMMEMPVWFFRSGSATSRGAGPSPSGSSESNGGGMWLCMRHLSVFSVRFVSAISSWFLGFFPRDFAVFSYNCFFPPFRMAVKNV